MSVAHKVGSRWVIAACEDPFISVEFDFAVTLRRGDGLVVRIEEPFVLRASDGSSVTLDPEGDVEVLAPLLRVVRDELTGGVAHPDGALELTFASGTSIAVSPSEDFEAWERERRSW